MKPLKSLARYVLQSYFDWVDKEENLSHVQVICHTDEVTFNPSIGFKEDHIVFNLAPKAMRGFKIGDDCVSFEARFKGVVSNISFPYGSLHALFAIDNEGNQRAFMEICGMDEVINHGTHSQPQQTVRQKPILSLVQGGKDDSRQSESH